MNNAKKYFTVIEKIDGIWTPQWGDFDRDAAKLELDDMVYSDPDAKRKNFAIMTSQPGQKNIDSKINELNLREATK